MARRRPVGAGPVVGVPLARPRRVAAPGAAGVLPGLVVPGSVKRRLKRRAGGGEEGLHAAVARLLERIVAEPAVWAPYPAGWGRLSGQQRALFSRLGLRKNWPDFLIGHGAMFGLELKSAEGELSYSHWETKRDRRGNVRRVWVEGQRDGFPRLLASGAFKEIRVARSLDEVEAVLRGWGVPLKGHVAA